ncbi:MAG: tetratricopeptide repeat protein, partial [Desulfofustis sp.]
QELLEVLKIINEHDPGDMAVVAKISRIYLRNRDYDKCLTFLDESDSSVSDRSQFLLLRSRCEAEAGLEVKQLQSYTAYLQIRPDDHQFRRRSIELAGSLGLLERLRDLYGGRTDTSVSADGALEASYVHGLLLSGLTDEADQFLGSLSVPGMDIQAQLRIYKDLASSYTSQNHIFKAEQVLRKFAARHPRNPDSYLALAATFIDRKDLANARLWLQPLLQGGQGKSVNLDELSSAQKSRLINQQLRLDDLAGLTGVRKRAIDYLNNRLKENTIEPADYKTLLYAAKSLLRDNRYDDCIKLLKTFRSQFDRKEQIDSLLFISKHSQDGSYTENHPAIRRLSVSSGFEVVDQLVELGQLEAAHQLVSELSSRLPESTRITVYRARTGLLTSRLDEAFNAYTALVEAHPEESWFREQLLRTQILQGRPEPIFSIFSVAADDTGRKDRIDLQLESMDYPKAKLMWARALWAEDRWEEALDVYGLIDTELKRVVDKLIAVIQEHPELLDQLPEEGREADIVAKIMSTKFVSENLANAINVISADYYSAYRWSIIVEKEVAAKSALKAREFYQAEIDYQELFEEDPTTVEENYPDLATVYGRLGRYKQESELIETIQERSIFYPALPEVSEKSVRRQRPQLSIDGGYREEDGRDGYKDITEKYAGLGLQVKPTLYQEIGLSAGRSEYGDNSASTLAKSNRISSNYAIELSDNFQGDFHLGFEDFDTDGKSFLLYGATLFATLEQKVELYATIKQN